MWLKLAKEILIKNCDSRERHLWIIPNGESILIDGEWETHSSFLRDIILSSDQNTLDEYSPSFKISIGQLSDRMEDAVQEQCEESRMIRKITDEINEIQKQINNDPSLKDELQKLITEKEKQIEELGDEELKRLFTDDLYGDIIEDTAIQLGWIRKYIDRNLVCYEIFLQENDFSNRNIFNNIENDILNEFSKNQSIVIEDNKKSFRQEFYAYRWIESGEKLYDFVMRSGSDFRFLNK